MNSAAQIIEFTQECGKCKEHKPLSAFWRDSRRVAQGRDGRNRYCRSCLIGARRRYALLDNNDPVISGGTRQCNKCGVTRPLTSFTRSTHYPLGRAVICQPCKNAWRHARRIKKPKAAPIQPTQRDYRRLKYKGVSAEAFKVLFDAQNGKCGICASEMDFLAKSTCLDHDHSTGLIRGVLCQRCNLGIGHMRDDIGLMRAAIVYLEKYEEK